MMDLTSDQSFQLAQHLVTVGDLAGAIERCQAILAEQPDHLGARVMASMMQFQSGLIAAYRLNLSKRPDRLAKSLRNQARYGYPDNLITRVDAIEDTECGAIGCGKSHITALTDALLHRTSPYCLVLEDDFDFLEPAYVLTERLAELKASGMVWDMLILGGVDATPYQDSDGASFLLRLFESRSTIGYLVNRHYLPTLLNCFVQAVAQFERYRDLAPRPAIAKRLAIDSAWRKLQRMDRWYIFNPALGHQRSGYSDIEAGFVDYGARSFYISP